MCAKKVEKERESKKERKAALNGNNNQRQKLLQQQLMGQSQRGKTLGAATAKVDKLQ